MEIILGAILSNCHDEMVSLNNVNYITVKFIGKFSDKLMTIVKAKILKSSSDGSSTPLSFSGDIQPILLVVY